MLPLIQSCLFLHIIVIQNYWEKPLRAQMHPQRMLAIGKQRGDRSLYDVVPVGDWVRKVIDAGMHSTVATLIETFDEPEQPPYPVLSKERQIV